MRIAPFSDLHTEFAPYSLAHRTDADVIILAGDNADNPIALGELIATRPPGVPVVVLLGNHEFYGHDYDTVLLLYQTMCDALEDVHLLNDRSITIGDVEFSGGTLWTNFLHGEHIKSCQYGMNDFRCIEKDGGIFNPRDAVKLHQKTLTFLMTLPPVAKRYIVTHHAPTFKVQHPRWVNSTISGGFCSDLDHQVQRISPDIWQCGHLHEPYDGYPLGPHTRFVLNPRGYVIGGRRENPAFDPYKVVEL